MELDDYFYKKILCMRISKIISKWIYGHSLVCIVILVLIVFAPYIIVFAKNGISQQTQDWSYLGSYIGGTLSVVSIFLLYITYREQRRTNHIDHFMKAAAYHVDSIVKLQEKNKETIRFLSDKIVGLFFYLGEYEYNNEYTKEEAEKVIGYSYSDLTINTQHNNRSFEDVFQYIGYAFNHIEDDTLIEGKSNYVKEIDSVLTLDSKVILFCYIVSYNRWDLLKICDKYCIFRDWNMENDMFNHVVSMFCKNSKAIPKPSESPLIPDLYEIKDNTTFYDILEHLKHNKQKREDIRKMDM